MADSEWWKDSTGSDGGPNVGTPAWASGPVDSAAPPPRSLAPSPRSPAAAPSFPPPAPLAPTMVQPAVHAYVPAPSTPTTPWLNEPPAQDLAAWQSTYAIGDTPQRYTSWGRRFAARCLDALLLTIVAAAGAAASYFISNAWDGSTVAGLALLLTLVADLIVATAYHLAGAASGQTWGKKVLGYRTQRLDGRPLGFWLALGREILNLVSTIPFMLGWLAPLWSARRQTWHDSITGTVSVDAPSPRGAQAAVSWMLVTTLLTVAGGAVGAHFLDEASSFSDYDPYYSYDPYEPEGWDAPGSDFCPENSIALSFKNAMSVGDGGWQSVDVTFTDECGEGRVIADSNMSVGYENGDCWGRSNFDLSYEPISLAAHDSWTTTLVFDDSWCPGPLRFSWDFSSSVDNTIGWSSGPNELGA